MSETNGIDLSEKEINDLIVKGECDRNGFKITARHESVFDEGKEHVLLYDYKKKVSDLIDSNSNKNSRHYEDSWSIRPSVFKEKLGLK